jgi:hypothetical protein
MTYVGLCGEDREIWTEFLERNDPLAPANLVGALLVNPLPTYAKASAGKALKEERGHKIGLNPKFN